MSAVQVHAALGRRRGHRHVRGRDDRVRARRRRFLGGVVRAVSDDLARARGPRQESRGTPEGREGRRRRESRTRFQVWRAVDPVARRDPGRERGRPSCRRAASRCAGAAVAASARRLSVDLGSTFRQRGVSPGAELLGPRVNEVRDVMARVATHPRRLAGDQRMLVGESDSQAGATAGRIVAIGSPPARRPDGERDRRLSGPSAAECSSGGRGGPAAGACLKQRRRSCGRSAPAATGRHSTPT